MLLSGMMSEHSTVQSGVERWILSLGDSPASPSLWLDNGKGMPTSEICGWTQSESLAKYDPDTHSLRTFQVLLALDTLKPSSVTLPRSGMIVNGTLYLRPSLEHHTLENGSGCWLGTTTAGTGTKGRSAEWRKGKKPNPQEAAMMWRTPSQSDGEGGVMRMGEGDGKYKLRDQVQEINRQFWPSPQAQSAGKGLLLNELVTKEGEPAKKGERAYNPKTGLHTQITLDRAVKMWPTPTEHGNYNRKGLSKTSGDGLATAVGGTETQPKGQLNPQWVEWLMGFPEGWSDLKCLGMRGFRRWLQGFLK